MSRMNRRRFTWVATSGVASAALVGCGEAVDEDLTPTQIPDVAGAPPTLAPQVEPFESEEAAEEVGAEEVADAEVAAEEGAEEEVAAEEEGAAEEVAAGGAQTHVVEMTDELVFDPVELTIDVGDTVVWRTTGAIPHTSTCDPEQSADPQFVNLPEGAEPWDSGLVNSGEEFSHTLEAAGNYTYFCVPHAAAGMIGYLTVVEGGAEAEVPEEEAVAAEEEEAAGEEQAVAAGGAIEPITVQALDTLAFDPSDFEATPGQEIHVVNAGSLQHDFVVDELELATELLNGGEEATLTVPDDAAVGETYTYFCSVPGHREAGMEGTMVIVEAGAVDAAEDVAVAEEPNAAATPEEAAAAAEAEGGEEAAAAGTDAAVTVQALDALAFDPSEFEVSPGQEILVVNAGVLQHDFVVDEMDLATELLNGGEEATITVPEDAEPGEYIFYCSVPGHREAGMEGTMLVV